MVSRETSRQDYVELYRIGVDTTEIDFTKLYKKGDVLFYANIEESLVRKLRLRTVENTYMVGVVNKSDTVFIGKDKMNILFKSMIDAKNYVDSHCKNTKIDITYDIPDQLTELEEEEVGEEDE